MSCWQTLGIAPTSDEAAIKQAYAARIREHRPDRDPEGFRAVRAAYEEALRLRVHIRPHHEKKMQRRCAAEAAPDAASAAMADQNPPAAAETPHIPPDTAYYGYTAALPPEITEALREPENVAYLERPAPHERETAPHDYRDRPADTRENPAALLARLQGEWQDASDDKLLAILQAQADEAALQHIDLRIDYLDALRQHLASRDHLPRSTVWAGEQYQLHHSHDAEYRRRYLAARVALNQPPEFIHSPRYAALADWLQQSPWRRRLALWRDWTASREHPAYRQWQALYHDLAPQLRSASAPGLDRQLFYRRSLLVATSLALAGIASLGGNTAGVVQILLVLFYNIYLATSDFPEYDLAKYHLYRSSPPLRTLDHAYHPLPYGAYWLLADLAVIARTLTAPEPPWTGFAALWFTLRGFQTLWSLKRAILVGWQPTYPPDVAQPLMTAAIQLACLGLWLPRALNGEAMPLLYAITALLGIGLYGLCWLRLPAECAAQRRTMLDLAPAVLIPPLAFLGDSDPYYSAGALLLAPLLALALYYQYSPRWRDVLPLATFAVAVEIAAVLYLGASLRRLGSWSAAHGIGYLPVFVLTALLALHYLAWLLQGFADDEPLRG